MTSSGGELKIYLRGVTPHTLIHGGLGHRHLLCKDLIFMEFIWISLLFRGFHGKHTQILVVMVFLLLLIKLECEVHFSVTISIPSHALLLP